LSYLKFDFKTPAAEGAALRVGHECLPPFKVTVLDTEQLSFAEGQVRGDDLRDALVELADQMEQKRSASRRFRKAATPDLPLNCLFLLALRLRQDLG
jgi:hypothetical protein